MLARAKRLVLDHAADRAEEADDSLTIGPIAKAARSAPDDDLRRLANLYHSARLACNYALAALGQHQHDAGDLYPAEPAELSWPLPPRQAEPQWRVDIRHHWEKQCAAIDKGLGLDLAEAEALAAQELRDDLGQRATDAPVKTAEDAREKLGVMAWRVEIEDLAPEDIAAMLHKLGRDLDQSRST